MSYRDLLTSEGVFYSCSYVITYAPANSHVCPPKSGIMSFTTPTCNPSIDRLHVFYKLINFEQLTPKIEDFNSPYNNIDLEVGRFMQSLPTPQLDRSDIAAP